MFPGKYFLHISETFPSLTIHHAHAVSSLQYHYRLNYLAPNNQDDAYCNNIYYNRQDINVVNKN